jgi:hypothetical protein
MMAQNHCSWGFFGDAFCGDQLSHYMDLKKLQMILQRFSPKRKIYEDYCSTLDEGDGDWRGC